MKDFTINVQVTPIRVQLDVTPEMAELLTALLQSGLTKKTVKPQTRKSTVKGAEPVKEEHEEKPEAPKTEQSETTKEAEPQKEGDTPKAEPSQTPPEGTSKQPTAEDVRAAMHRTRQRIEGEDYKDHTDSELYQKYHKELTRQFKNIAAELGADKPSALPEERRESFIDRCDLLTVLEDGNVGLNLPF